MKKNYEIFIDKLLRKPISKEADMIMRINNALLELNRAKNHFDMVVGADNVELAILEINTAEKRYRNLLKEAKALKISRFSVNKSTGTNEQIE